MTADLGAAEPRVVLEARDLIKSYGRNDVLKGVDIRCVPGRVQALLGLNGAGKSTLINILTGASRPDSGEILVDGDSQNFRSPAAALGLGIAVVHQELSLIDDLDVAENMFLNREPTRRRLIDAQQLYSDASSVVQRLGLDLDVRGELHQLSVAKRQLVEIAKALAVESRVLILDEPTASLSAHEQEQLFVVLRGLRDRGVSIIYVSHRLDEIAQIADEVTVLRDGVVVLSAAAKDVASADLVAAMTGNTEPSALFPGRAQGGGTRDTTPRLAVLDLGNDRGLNGVSFEVARGEIVALAGLVGSGKSSVLRTLFGLQRSTVGKISVDGVTVDLRSARQAIRAGIAYVTEDRKRDGLALRLSALDNLVSVHLPSWMGLYRRRKARDDGRAAAEAVAFEYPLSMNAGMLSGGNQQKLSLGKWLVAKPSILICDEPTRGIDVAAKAEVYRVLRQLADDGLSVLVSSSDFEEVAGLADRILVMSRGTIVWELTGGSTSAREVLLAAASVSDSDPRKANA